MKFKSDSLLHFTALFLLLLTTGCAGQNVNIANSKEYSTISQLRRDIGVPAECGKAAAGEGSIVTVTGFVDWINVFSKSKYPQLPYQKLKINDKEGKESIEVWVESKDDGEIFELLAANEAKNRSQVFIKGTVTGFDMPIMGKCRRDIRVVLKSKSDISF